jgi:hypothetical protein
MGIGPKQAGHLITHSNPPLAVIFALLVITSTLSIINMFPKALHALLALSAVTAANLVVWSDSATPLWSSWYTNTVIAQRVAKIAVSDPKDIYRPSQHPHSRPNPEAKHSSNGIRRSHNYTPCCHQDVLAFELVKYHHPRLLNTGHSTRLRQRCGSKCNRS